MRTRMRGVVEAGGEKPPAIRLLLLPVIGFILWLLLGPKAGR
ncbi:hypothetical protein [Ectothiorhodospira shaposhnikovii]|nr:hypothetical protein [Ectothiorhodospira shaposhnikovii]